MSLDELKMLVELVGRTTDTARDLIALYILAQLLPPLLLGGGGITLAAYLIRRAIAWGQLATTLEHGGEANTKAMLAMTAAYERQNNPHSVRAKLGYGDYVNDGDRNNVVTTFHLGLQNQVDKEAKP